MEEQEEEEEEEEMRIWIYRLGSCFLVFHSDKWRFARILSGSSCQSYRRKVLDGGREGSWHVALVDSHRVLLDGSFRGFRRFVGLCRVLRIGSKKLESNR